MTPLLMLMLLFAGFGIYGALSDRAADRVRRHGRSEDTRGRSSDHSRLGDPHNVAYDRGEPRG